LVNTNMASTRAQHDGARSSSRLGIFIVVGLSLAVLLAINYGFFRVAETDVCDPGDRPDHCAAKRLKYGSLGGEVSTGLPYRVFQVLPEVFAEYLPNDGAKRMAEVDEATVLVTEAQCRQRSTPTLTKEAMRAAGANPIGSESDGQQASDVTLAGEKEK
jgi:hypothetical protein